MTLQPNLFESTADTLTSSQAGFRASHTVLPGSEEGMRMTARSGRKCVALLQQCGHAGSLVRTLLEVSE